MRIMTIALAVFAGASSAQDIEFPADAGPQARAVIRQLTISNEFLRDEIERMEARLSDVDRGQAGDDQRFRTVSEGFEMCQQQRIEMQDRLTACDAALAAADPGATPSAEIRQTPTPAAPAPAAPRLDGQTCAAVAAEREELLAVFSEQHPRVLRLTRFLDTACGG